jgi:hypothetical protein
MRKIKVGGPYATWRREGYVAIGPMFGEKE